MQLALTWQQQMTQVSTDASYDSANVQYHAADSNR
jgi:hypothetical protein